MRIEDIQTFLEVASTGSFSRAAKRLHVTQSTVSARVQALEDELGGAPLFVRGRGGAQLTGAGWQLQRYALTLTQLWQRARQEVALPPGFRTSFAVGVQMTLWEQLMVPWIPWMREQAPDVALHLEADFSDTLMDHLEEGLLYVGVMYTPRTVPGLVVESLLEETLVMVASEPRSLKNGFPEDYIYVNWGDTFAAAHAEAFPEVRAAPMAMGLPEMALRHIVDHAGAAYLLRRQVAPHLEAGRLHEVAHAPAFTRPAYMVYPEKVGDDDVLALALEGLRKFGHR